MDLVVSYNKGSTQIQIVCMLHICTRRGRSNFTIKRMSEGKNMKNDAAGTRMQFSYMMGADCADISNAHICPNGTHI